MTTKIEKFMKEDGIVDIVSNEIADLFLANANKETVDYIFDIKKGTGKVADQGSNTFFSYDIDPGTRLEELKKILFDEDIAALTEEDEKKLMEEAGEFFGIVCTNISKNYTDKIRQKIREVVMPTSDEQSIPLKNINIVNIDILDASVFPEPTKYLLKIDKKQGKNVNIPTDDIAVFIHEKQEETGLSVEEVFFKERQDPIFKNVDRVTRGSKFLYDLAINLFVDYSLSNLPPL
jgi:hypothetical protein